MNAAITKIWQTFTFDHLEHCTCENQEVIWKREWVITPFGLAFTELVPFQEVECCTWIHMVLFIGGILSFFGEISLKNTGEKNEKQKSKVDVSPCHNIWQQLLITYQNFFISTTFHNFGVVKQNIRNSPSLEVSRSQNASGFLCCEETCFWTLGAYEHTIYVVDFCCRNR